MENDAGRIIGIIAGVLFIIGAGLSVISAYLVLSFFSSFLPSIPLPLWTMVADFIWGAASGIVIIYVAARYAGSSLRRTRVKSGILIIILAFAGSYPTAGGEVLGFLLAIIAGALTIAYRNYNERYANIQASH